MAGPRLPVYNHDIKTDSLSPANNIKNVPIINNNEQLGPTAFAPAMSTFQPDYKLIYNNNIVYSEFYLLNDHKQREEKHLPKLIPGIANDIKQLHESFKSQFNQLLDKLDVLFSHEQHNNIQILKDKFFDPSYSGNQAAIYFSFIKLTLEKIYLLLQNTNIPLCRRKKIYSDLCESFTACSPGLHDHIDHAYQQLDGILNNNLTSWLAEFRTQLIEDYALRLHLDKFPRQRDRHRIGNQTHTRNALMILAFQHNWNPKANIKSNTDNFIIDSNISNDDFQDFTLTFIQSYNPSTISDAIYHKLQSVIYAKIDELGLVIDKQHKILYDKKFYDWLTTLFINVFGPNYDYHSLIEIDESNGDPARSYINTILNQYHFHTLFIQIAIDKSIFIQPALKNQSIKFKLNLAESKTEDRYFLFNHYFPVPFDIKTETNFFHHWISLPDEELCKLLDYWITNEFKQATEQWIANINKKNRTATILPNFIHALIEHTHSTRKIKSLNNLIQNIREPLIRLLNEKHLISLLAYFQKYRLACLKNNEYFILDYYYPLTQNHKWYELSDEDTVKILNYLTSTHQIMSPNFLPDFLVHIVKYNKYKSLSALSQLFNINLQTKYENDYQVIHIAAKYGTVEAMEVLLNPEFKIDVNSYANKITAAEIAAEKNRPQTLKLLLKHQANITNLMTSNTILLSAVKSNQIDSLEVILDHLSKLYTENKNQMLSYLNHQPHGDNKSALLIAVENDNPRAVKLLARAGADIENGNPVIYAVKHHKNNALKALIEEKAPINKHERYFYPLHYAYISINAIAFELLCQAGAHLLNLPSDTFTSPLFSLINFRTRNSACLKIALKYKIDIDKRIFNANTKTPLEYAIDEYDLELFEQLLIAGASVTLRDMYGDLPIHRVLSKKPDHYTNMINLLLKYTKPVTYINELDHCGNTPIHIALNNNQDLILLELIKHGANLNICDYDKKTPLYYAVTKNNIAKVRLLVSNRSAIDFNNEINKLAISIAKQSNYTEIYYLLTHQYLTNLAFAPVDKNKLNFITSTLAQYRTQLMQEYCIKNFSADNDAFTSCQTYAALLGWHTLGNSLTNNRVIDDMTHNEFMIFLEKTYTPENIIHQLTEAMILDIKSQLNIIDSIEINRRLINYFLKIFNSTSICIPELYKMEINFLEGTFKIEFNKKLLNDLFLQYLCKNKFFTEKYARKHIFIDTYVYLRKDYFPLQEQINNWFQLPEDQIIKLLEYIKQHEPQLTTDVSLYVLSPFFETLASKAAEKNYYKLLILLVQKYHVKEPGLKLLTNVLCEQNPEFTTLNERPRQPAPITFFSGQNARSNQIAIRILDAKPAQHKN